MKVLIDLIALLVLQIGCADFYEYCLNGIEESLCSNFRHTLCAPDPLTCFEEDTDTIAQQFVGYVPITPKLVRISLELHNYYRNKLASGTEINSANNKRYLAASRMREVLWNWELTFLSHNHLKYVRMGHDNCHNSWNLGKCGQNLGFLGFEFEGSVVRTINNSMYEFYLEKNLVDDPVTMAGLFELKYIDVHAAHFTQLISDRNAHIGCGAALGANCLSKGANYEYCYYYVCHYDFPNTNGSYIYKTSDKSADSCADWETTKSDNFEFLCKNNGKLYSKKLRKRKYKNKPKQ